MLDTLCIPLMTHTETYSFSASLSVLLLSIACYSPELTEGPNQAQALRDGAQVCPP